MKRCLKMLDVGQNRPHPPSDLGESVGPTRGCYVDRSLLRINKRPRRMAGAKRVAGTARVSQSPAGPVCHGVHRGDGRVRHGYGSIPAAHRTGQA